MANPNIGSFDFTGTGGPSSGLPYQTYPGNPTGNLTPLAAGIQCLDTTNHVWYYSTGVTNTSWVQFVSNISSSGASVIRKFPFTYATPNIATGAALYTPTIGDVLLDAWIEIDTAWNGTTPLCDIGFGVASMYGLFDLAGLSVSSSQVDMTYSDSTFDSSALYGSSGNRLSLAQTLDSAIAALQATGAVSPFPLSQISTPFLDGARRIVPFKFAAANPVKVWVTQNGRNTGAATGATQGSAILYLVTATPI